MTIAKPLAHTRLVLGRRSVLGAGRAAGVSLLLVAFGLGAQAPADTAKKYTLPMIFRDSTPVEITLTAPFRQLKRERRGNTPYHGATITYAGDSGIVAVPVRVKTRGIWRRAHCDLPPLRLNFTKDSTKKTLFRHLDRARLSMHCRDNDDYEQYVLQEFQLYRVQRQLTSMTLHTRLLRVTYVDSEKKDTLGRRYAFIMEEDDDFAARMGGMAIKAHGATPDDVDPKETAIFGTFEFMIGNTDYSVAGLHNVVVLQRDMTYYPVAHDYDFSGAVNTRYATPPEVLEIRSVTERKMRGYCVPPAYYEQAFALFKAKKDAIYALYHDSLAAPLKPDVIDRTLRYFDRFYEILDTPRMAQRMIIDGCLDHGA